jgi:hypothetical protein
MAITRYIKKITKSIIKWAVSEESKSYPEDSCVPSSLAKNSNVINDRSNAMNFTVHAATGGKVIQVSVYDPRTDRHNTSLYVITDKEDLGEELSQIITKESLSR